MTVESSLRDKKAPRNCPTHPSILHKKHRALAETQAEMTHRPDVCTEENLQVCTGGNISRIVGLRSLFFSQRIITSFSPLSRMLSESFDSGHAFCPYGLGGGSESVRSLR